MDSTYFFLYFSATYADNCSDRPININSKNILSGKLAQYVEQNKPPQTCMCEKYIHIR